MAEFKSYLTKMTVKYQGSEEEKACCDVMFTDLDIVMGDKRLNSIAARTYNTKACQNIFVLIEKGLTPSENPWKTILKTLLLLHTITIYGSELAVDQAIAIARFVFPLQQYNTAFIKRGFFGVSGGTDYGQPVRQAAKNLYLILSNDENIRKARQNARQGQDTLVPIGEYNEEYNPTKNSNSYGNSGKLLFGQGIDTSVGAGHGLESVPGMYEGRPERYFDRDDDPRRRVTEVKNHQLTRDVSCYCYC